MAIKIIKQIVPKSKYPLKCPYPMTAKFIVVHNTANDATAREEIAYMTKNNKDTSFHFACDDKEIVQGIYEGRNAWHAGDGRKGNGNRNGIAIEICYSKSGGTKFKKAEQNAVLLIADILKRHKLGIDKVTKHQQYSGKDCPHLTMQLGWDRFIKMVKVAMKPTVPVPPIPPVQPPTCEELLSKAKAEKKIVEGQLGTALEEVIELKNQAKQDSIAFIEMEKQKKKYDGLYQEATRQLNELKGTQKKGLVDQVSSWLATLTKGKDVQ